MGGAVPIMQIGADRELTVGIDVRNKRDDLWCDGAPRPKTQEAVFLDIFDSVSPFDIIINSFRKGK